MRQFGENPPVTPQRFNAAFFCYLNAYIIFPEVTLLEGADATQVGVDNTYLDTGTLHGDGLLLEKDTAERLVAHGIPRGKN